MRITTLTAALVLAPAIAAGQQSAEPIDTRWQALAGCWQPVERDERAALCVAPVGGSAAELVTVAGGRAEARERLDASGVQRPGTRDRCAGWDRGRWSADGRRVYLRSEHDCNGVRLLTTGVLALVGPSEWVDVRGVSMAGGPANVTVRRYHLADGAIAAAGMPAVVEGDALRGAARANANARLSSAEVVEATREVDARVVEAWLVERGQAFDLDAGRLAAMADAGVPERVIDIVVALTYPKRFAIDRRSRDAELRPSAVIASTRADSLRPSAPPIGAYCDGPSFSGGRCASSRYASCSYEDYYEYGPYSADRGCGAGSRYGYLGGGYYGYGNGGTVIVIREPSTGAERDAEGRVVKGKGYTRSGGATESGGGDRRAARARPSGNAERDRATATPRGGRGSGSSDAGTESTKSTKSSGASEREKTSSGERTAKPRP